MTHEAREGEGGMKSIGYCKDCKWRDASGTCTNDDKLHEEDYDHMGKDTKDHLVYSYYEGGWFLVGELFGCIHWQKRGGQP